jgi:hypothetical protein
MAGILSDFDWYRHRKGYRMVSWRDLFGPEPTYAFERALWITPMRAEDDVVKYRPFVRDANICDAFASVKTPDQLLRFFNDHGPLTGRRYFRPPPDYPRVGESVSDGLEMANRFQEMRRLKALGDLGALVAHLDKKMPYLLQGEVGKISLEADKKRGLWIRVMPSTLIDALRYQLWQKLADTELRVCPLCDGEFQVGPGSRRADAMFCCNEHKVQYFNRKRRSAKVEMIRSRSTSGQEKG